MTRKIALVCVSLCVFLSAALALEASDLASSGRKPLVGGSPRLWARSLSGATHQITVGRTSHGSGSTEGLLAISAAEWTEIVRSPAQEELQVGAGEDLVLVNASPRFAVTDTEIGPGPRAAAAGTKGSGGNLKPSDQASFTVTQARGPLPVTLLFSAPKSSAEVQLRSGGTLLGFVNVASEKPVSVKLDLSSLLARRLKGESVQVEVRALRGDVSASSSRGQFLRAVTPKSFGGNAIFNYTAQWQFTPDLYYYISSAPISTCGELDTYRNGSWLYSSGWACTDASGSVTKGPWSWSSTPSDQTDDPVFIRWPDGSTTTSLIHYWDKTCPTITRTSPSGSPPGTYYGTASDTQWGACFSASWPTTLSSTFYDQNSHLYWDPSSRGYTSSSPIAVAGSLSGMPSCAVGWSTNFPALSAHTSGHDYLWETCITESSDGCTVCTNLPFVH